MKMDVSPGLRAWFDKYFEQDMPATGKTVLHAFSASEYFLVRLHRAARVREKARIKENVRILVCHLYKCYSQREKCAVVCRRETNK